MTDVAVVTGSASGIGAAVRERFERDGLTVLGIDLRNADVEADLSTVAGRDAAATAIDAVNGSVVAVVACAGVVGPDEVAVRVNFFGATAVLDAARPRLAEAQGGAVAIASYALTSATRDDAVVAACLADDEPEAVRAVGEAPGTGYGTSKLALALWVRARAATGDWAGSGIRLNTVAPGVVRTPLMDSMLGDPAGYDLALSAVPSPIGGAADPADIASVVSFLTNADARFVVGQTLFVDGGADATHHPNEL